MNSYLEPLKNDEIKDSIKELAKIDEYSVVITLIDGKLLFGDLRPNFQFFDELPDENKWWVAKEEDNYYIAIELQPKLLFFNTEAGEKFGSSYCINLNTDIISDIKPLNWVKNLIPLRWIPNPYAKLICKNNIEVIEHHGLEILYYSEKSLSPSQIPPEGIQFNLDEIIYVDWEFLSRISGGSNGSIGAMGIGFKPARTLYQLAADKLKNGSIEKIINFLPTNTNLTDKRICGYIVTLNEDISTVIEGEEGIIILCCEKQKFSKEEKFLPIFLKKKSICYPREYLPYIKSKMVFYGEIKQIPFNEQKISSNTILMARAIGYVKK